jgi:hypothetical protein
MKRYGFYNVASLMALVLAATVSADTAIAQKKGGGGSTGPAGIVYFQSYPVGSPFVTGYVKADGTGSAVAVRNGEPYFTEASHLLHGGQRWFLTSDFNSVAVTPEDGNPVLLFTDPDFTVVEEPHWVRNTDDGWVTFSATVSGTNPETGQSEIVEAGIFTIQVAYDADGNITGSVPGTFQLVLSTSGLGGLPYGHDWGPAGELLLVTWDGGEFNSMWIADFSDPADPLIVPVNTGSGNRVGSPTWSPDGTRIAFNEATTGIVIMTLASGQRKTIKSTATTGVGRPLWSPTGGGIIYQQGRYGEAQSDVYRASANGTNRTYLATGRALGWRE